jgi:hypothetical protein
VTQRARTVAIQPDFCRNDRYGGRLALRADHFNTSGDPKRTELPKRFEGVIQHNGIRGEISTGTILKKQLNMNESNIMIHNTELTVHFMELKSEVSETGKMKKNRELEAGGEYLMRFLCAGSVRLVPAEG